MTRINLMDPSVLTSRHLLAEFKEITQVLHPLSITLSKGDLTLLKSKIPPNYTLNTGHVCFWYDKGDWLIMRFKSLRHELVVRGVNIDNDLFEQRLTRMADVYSNSIHNEWQASYNDIVINAERIMYRINEKPHLYPDMDRFTDWWHGFLHKGKI